MAGEPHGFAVNIILQKSTSYTNVHISRFPKIRRGLVLFKQS